MEKIPKFNKRRAFNKAVGPGKNPKLINVGPTFIPDYRVIGVWKIITACANLALVTYLKIQYYILPSSA